jgi:hypothetical protein
MKHDVEYIVSHRTNGDRHEYEDRLVLLSAARPCIGKKKIPTSAFIRQVKFCRPYDVMIHSGK